jgi:hypothetical protein
VDPAQLFPWIAAAFAAAGLWRWWRSGRVNGAPATWLLLALIFAAVAAWLRWPR